MFIYPLDTGYHWKHYKCGYNSTMYALPQIEFLVEESVMHKINFSILWRSLQLDVSYGLLWRISNLIIVLSEVSEVAVV